MAALICFPPSLSSLSTNTIPKLSTPSSFSNTRCFFPHKAPCLSNFVARYSPLLYQHVIPRFYFPVTQSIYGQVWLCNIVDYLCQIRAYNWGNSEYDDDDNGKYTKEDYDSIEIEIVKTGNNSRRIRSKVRIQASLQAVWDILTDYEGLADFIPGLAVSKLLEKTDNFVRLFQVFTSFLTNIKLFSTKFASFTLLHILGIIPIIVYVM